jgi:hypothetical protein
MSKLVDEYDLPPTNIEPHRLAKHVIRQKTLHLTIASIAIVLAGLMHTYLSADHTVFPRYGALLTIVAIGHSWRQLRFARKTGKISKLQIDIFTEVERTKMPENTPEDILRARAYKRVSRILPGFYEAIAFQFIGPSLVVAAIGNAIWGFGDLLPLP